MRNWVITLLAAGTACTTGGCGLGGPGSGNWFQRTMRQIRGKPIAEAFVDIDKPEPDLRRESVAAMAVHPHTRGNPDVHRLLAHMALGQRDEVKGEMAPDSDLQVRVAALAALRTNVAELTDDQRRRLRNLLAVANENQIGGREFNRDRLWLRVEAAECLGVFLHDEGADRLVETLRTDPDTEVRLTAARVLGKYKGVAADRRLPVVEALAENASLRDGRPFALKYECVQSLRELTGRGDLDYDPVAWRKHFQENAANPFEHGGETPVRVAQRGDFFDSIGLSRLLYMVRKPAVSDE